MARFLGIPLTRIVAFHDVPPNLSREFRRKISYIKENTNIITLDDFLTGKLSTSRMNVAITFDDGYKGWVDNALPVLNEYGVKATMFISYGFVGLKPEERDRFIKNNLKSGLKLSGALEEGDVLKILHSGHALGGHTLNHIDLTQLSDTDLIRKELESEKKYLEEKTKSLIKYFAYPFGFSKNPGIDLTNILKDVGYSGALTTVSGFNSEKTNRYLLNRDLVDVSLSMSAFKARLHGNHDPSVYIRSILKEFYPV